MSNFENQTAAFLCFSGLNAFWIVGLKHFPEYHMLQELEFGRGFSYREPLYFENPELPSMLRRTLVSFFTAE